MARQSLSVIIIAFILVSTFVMCSSSPAAYNPNYGQRRHMISVPINKKCPEGEQMSVDEVCREVWPNDDENSSSHN